MIYKAALSFIAAALALPAIAQDLPAPQPVVVFQSGGGNNAIAPPVFVKPPRAEISCDMLALSNRAIEHGYFGAVARPKQRLDAQLFATAVEKYRQHFCTGGRNSGPAQIVVVDFAKHSSEPRLYRLDLRDGQGIDSPILVAHGIGSDPDDDGYATVFSNVYSSYTSSLGAALGAERYIGANGVSLRLDGLEPSNNQMRVRDIVVHSYAPERRRYFNASLIAARGRPGSSEGCFVVEPDKRDWILDTLENGGFLYSGFSGEYPRPMAAPAQNVSFAPGTGVIPQPAPAAVSGTSAGMPGNLPIAPISPAPSAPAQ